MGEIRNTPTKLWLRVLSFVFILCGLLFTSYQLNNQHTFWWDEGWTLDAARNWVEQGYLGHYLDGQPVPVRIPVRFPVVVPVALSMEIFGVGLWQGRLPGAIFTVLTLALVYFLSSKMYNRYISNVTLIILALSPIYLHPLVIGSQVLAEMPMLFYLFAGYTFLWFAITRSPAWGIGSAFMFGIAIHAKLQVPPFWAASIASAIILAYIHNRKRTVWLLLSVAIGSIVFAVVVIALQSLVMPDSFNDPQLTEILINSVVVVLTLPARWQAIKHVLIYALPQFVGLTWSGYSILSSIYSRWKYRATAASQYEDNQEIIKLAIWVLCVSWFFWYILFGLFWLRYMYPPFFIASTFIAAYLVKATGGFDVRLLVRKISSMLLHFKVNWINIQALAILILMTSYLAIAVATWAYNATPETRSPLQAANYLRATLKRESVVESFESELFFLAPEINFHYPSDLVSMQLVRKFTLEPQLTIEYDPLEANPDYLVVGQYAHLWKLYDQVIDQGWFELETTIDGYKIFRRQPVP